MECIEFVMHVWIQLLVLQGDRTLHATFVPKQQCGLQVDAFSLGQWLWEMIP